MPVRQVPIQQQASVAYHLTPQNGRSPTEVNQVHFPSQQVAQVKTSRKHLPDGHWSRKESRQIYVRIASRLAPSLRAEQPQC